MSLDSDDAVVPVTTGDTTFDIKTSVRLSFAPKQCDDVKSRVYAIRNTRAILLLTETIGNTRHPIVSFTSRPLLINSEITASI